MSVFLVLVNLVKCLKTRNMTVKLCPYKYSQNKN